MESADAYQPLNDIQLPFFHPGHGSQTRANTVNFYAK